jgi:hypothetical protein
MCVIVINQFFIRLLKFDIVKFIIISAKRHLSYYHLHHRWHRWDGDQHVSIFNNRIGGVMGSVFSSSAVDSGFEHRSGQTKENAIGMCCFSAKHPTSRRKSKEWLARNHDNVSE